MDTDNFFGFDASLAVRETKWGNHLIPRCCAYRRNKLWRDSNVQESFKRAEKEVLTMTRCQTCEQLHLGRLIQVVGLPGTPVGPLGTNLRQPGSYVWSWRKGTNQISPKRGIFGVYRLGVIGNIFWRYWKSLIKHTNPNFPSLHIQHIALSRGLHSHR